MSDIPAVRLAWSIRSIAALGAALVAALGFLGAGHAYPNRHTRTVGKIAITANDFVTRPDGVVSARGDVRLGSGLRLTGANAVVEFTRDALIGMGTLETTGRQPIALWDGPFKASAATGIATPLPGAATRLARIGAIGLFNPRVGAVDIPAAAARGQATVTLGPRQQVTSTLSFNLLGGLFTGNLPPVEFAVAGSTIAAPNGMQLVDGGFYAPVATIALPANLGGGTVEVTDLRVANQTVRLGSATGSVALPDIALGRNDGLVLTGNVAQLVWDPARQDYRFDINGTLTTDGLLPGTANFNASLSTVDGQPQLSGAVSDLDFAVAGGTLAVGSATLTNAGLHAPTATLTLPGLAGGTSLVVEDVHVGPQGLVIGAGDFIMPGFVLADGLLAVNGVQASLVNEDGRYALDGQGTLTMDLPGNDRTTDVTLRLSPDGQLSGDIVGLQLDLAGATLTLGPTTIDSAGLTSEGALLQLPDELGGAATAIRGVVIDRNGLSFDAAGGIVNLPEIPIAEGISLQDNQAIVGLVPIDGRNYYALTVTSTLSIETPGNAQEQTIQFAIAPDATGAAQLYGSLSGLTLDLGGATMALADVTLRNDGLRAGSASLTVGPEFGGTSAALTDVRFSANGVSIQDGELVLPDIALADGALTITGARGDVVYDGEQYSFSAQGKLTMNLPSNTGATNTIEVTLTPDGAVVGQTPGLALDVGGATLALGPTTVYSGGLAASTATLALPREIGGLVTEVGDVTVTPSGVTFGGARASGRVPNISLGQGTLTENELAVATVRTEAGEQYALVADGTLNTGGDGASSGSPVRVIVNTGGPITDEFMGGLSLKLGDLNITIMER